MCFGTDNRIIVTYFSVISPARARAVALELQNVTGHGHIAPFTASCHGGHQ